MEQRNLIGFFGSEQSRSTFLLHIFNLDDDEIFSDCHINRGKCILTNQLESLTFYNRALVMFIDYLCLNLSYLPFALEEKQLLV